mgnify:CR=1 FL=1
MKIKNVEISNNLILAPMAGITDKAFRTICKEFGVGLTVTEMVSVKGLYYKSKKTEELLDTSNIERPCAVQLFGHEPEIFSSVIKSGILDKFDIIDINMGCPAPKIVKNGDGSTIMKDINLARQIITACVNATDKPVTVKFRKGFNKGDDFLIEFAKMCEESGASAITIHPRTREDFFSGKIDIEDIRKVKQSVNIPVIGNGDVVDKCSYEHMLSSGCDGVMIGRGSFGNPEIFSILLNKDIKLNKWQIIKRHLNLLREDYSDDKIVKLFKKHILAYLSGFKNANELKRQIVLVNSLNEIEKMLEDFFKIKNV